MTDADPIHVLRVAAPDDVAASADRLERAGDGIEVVTATDASEALDRVGSTAADCVVSAYELPGTDGVTLLRTVREEYGDLPFVLFTNTGSESVASEAVSAGVTEYVPREDTDDEYAALADRVRTAVETRRARRTVGDHEGRHRAYERITDGFFAVDTEWRYIAVNEAGARLVDRAREDLLGERVWEAFPAIADTPFEGALRDAMASGETTTVEAAYPPLDTWFDVRIYPDEDGLSIFFRDVTERVERERKLERYRTMVNAMGESACIYDEAGRFDVVNDYLAEFYDTTPQALVGERSHLIPEIRAQADGDPYRELVEGEREELVGEVDTEFPNRGRAVVDYRLARLTVDGEFDGVVAVARDVTDRTERAEELSFRTALLEALTETTIDGLLVVDSDREVLFHNERFRDIWGIPESVAAEGSDEELLDHVRDHLVDPDGFRERVEQLYGQPEAESRDTIALTDGRWIERYSAPVVGADGDETHYGRLWAFRDVTEREERERRIEALHDVTRSLMRAETPREIATVVVDTASDVLDLPIAGCWLYDDAEHRLEPAAVTDDSHGLVEDIPVYREGEGLSWDAFERGEIAVYEDLSTVEGTVNPDTSVRSEIIVPLGEYGVLNIGTTEREAFDEADVTLAEILGANVEASLARAERERELARQNERLERFAGIVSHDLRNPLNVLDGSLTLARETGASRHFDSCRQSVDRMSTLIDDLLVLARAGEAVGEATHVELAGVARECWMSVETADASLCVEGSVTLQADRGRFKQLLENLYRNAVEHGGTDVTVRVGDLDDEWGFYVADDGAGVPPDERDRVFESGYTTTDDGTGFGLAIVEQIAEAHGWTVRLAEGANGGARFEITGVGGAT